MNKRALYAIACAGFFLATSCSKYKQLGDADYSPQTVYMPTAAQVNASGVYEIISVAPPGIVYRYTVDATGNKLNIPLGVYRAGVDTKGSVNVNLMATGDTVSSLIASNRLTNTMLLPSTAYTLTPSVIIADESSSAVGILSVDINYLLANSTKFHAVAVGINSTDRTVNPRLRQTIVYIDPAFLAPVANFTTTVNAATKTVTFNNTSTNAVSFSWNYGDGSAPSTQRAAPYTYAASGTYTVTLTATGALGAANTSVKTATVIIP